MSELPPLTPEEEQLTIQIRSALRKKQVEEAQKKTLKLLKITNNDAVKKQFSRLLTEITQIKRKETEEGDESDDEDEDSKEIKIKVEKSKINFKDVKGMDHLKRQLKREMTLMLRSREAFLRHKLKPSGILLYGPPGVGKTFFLEALAGEYNMNVINGDLASIFSQWVGQTEKNIRKLVETAKANQPCVIILDETDAKLRNRETTEARGESAASLNATTEFLEKMQEVHNENLQVLFTGATNRIWDVDPAAKRPGRLGNLIYVPSPSLKDRFLLFRHYLKTVPNLKISPLGYLAISLATASYSPTDIEEICIQAKKQMLYRNIDTTKEIPTYTKEEYLALKAANKLPKKPLEKLTTRDVIRVIRKEFKNSSVDTWYVEAYKSMIGWDEMQGKTVKGKIFSKTVKEKVHHDGKITKEERRLYKDMFKDIKRSRRTLLYVLLIRKLARWSVI